MSRRKPAHARPNHMTPTERAECLRLYAAGETRNALADRYDRGIRTIDALITRKTRATSKINVDSFQ